MKNINLKIGVLGVCVISLVASGTPTYEVLNSDKDVTSILAGTAIQSNSKTGELKITDVSGTLNHKSRSTSLSAGGYTLDDANGPDGDGVITDGKSSAKNTGADFAGTYLYVTSYEQSYTLSGNSFDLTGISGVVTGKSEIPKKDIIATYSGDALANIATATATGFNLTAGKSEVVANFATSKVNVKMNGFTAFDKLTGTAATAPIDTIEIKDMGISENSFSGGTFSTSLAGADVDLTGGNKTNAAKGNFFGYDKDQKIPAEVGGTLIMKGDAGLVVGTFIGN